MQSSHDHWYFLPIFDRCVACTACINLEAIHYLGISHAHVYSKRDLFQAAKGPDDDIENYSKRLKVRMMIIYISL